MSENEWKILKWDEKPQTTKKGYQVSTCKQLFSGFNTSWRPWLLQTPVPFHVHLKDISNSREAEVTSAEMVHLIANAFLCLGVLSLCLSHTAMAIGTVS